MTRNQVRVHLVIVHLAREDEASRSTLRRGVRAPRLTHWAVSEDDDGDVESCRRVDQHLHALVRHVPAGKQDDGTVAMVTNLVGALRNRWRRTPAIDIDAKWNDGHPIAEWPQDRGLLGQCRR